MAFSGGKDSTVMMHLALKVAKSENCLPFNGVTELDEANG
ncbi:phosphoadenosine phosphosulfate reductase family protein [Flavivirga aquatica]